MKHTETFKVRFSESDHRARVTPVALYDYFQEAAIAHGDAVGMTPQALAERGFAWVLTRIHIQFLRFPSRREIVNVETWGSNLRGLYAVREWIAGGESGDIAARGTSRWVLIDLARKRAIRLPEFIRELYGEHEGRAIDDLFEKESPPCEPEHERHFHVRMSDLDTNRHANSACYIDWCLESVPDSIAREFVPESIELTYKKESILGDAIRAGSREEAPRGDGLRRFFHAIWRESDGALLSAGRSRWRALAGAAFATRPSP